ncbi:GNAT family N-acetyltransferase [Streptomyces sp. MB09-01]|uniref:GNAT family N-acetyltransferase n=1 Tax=Streptomyces sp. MB09-01 TaxID=3028666 RepID=UPI0029A0FF8E|nr:GNAT family N-acetyltransferase [Streptomyces sp. MB09-01]MDX3533895.1 GNAT family N-acetyltransferase [Streptomyces sp. MB09-01]
MSHLVVANGEGQHALWPHAVGVPSGWQATGFSGTEEDCLGHIAEVWTDMRPRSLWDLSAAAPNVLATERFVLRELTADQVAALLRDDASDEAWAPGYPFAGTLAAAGGFGKRTADQHVRGFGMYQVVRCADGRVIGDIGFHTPPQEGTVEVGFGLVESGRGAGYASGALHELTRWALDQPGVTTVVARTLKDNTASQAVLQRVGFRRTAEEAELLHYALGTEDREEAASRPAGRGPVADGGRSGA